MPVPELVPQVGAMSLSGLAASALSAVGVRAENPLGLPAAPRVVLLLIDGLGWEALQANRSAAPFLAASDREQRILAAPFPATTAVSLATLGTAADPREHGVTGYAMRLGVGTDPSEDVLNCLTWSTYGPSGHDARDRFPPEQVQPRPTIYQRAVRAGVAASAVGPLAHTGSGLGRAVLRGAAYSGVAGLGDLGDATVRAAGHADRTLTYAYHPDLDATGHLRGVGSAAWRAHLRHVDLLVQELVDRLPRGTLLLVTGDHGMVDTTPEDRVDLDLEPSLLEGTILVTGDARARQVYVRPGAAADVASAWADRLGDRAWIVGREEALAAGWFGPAGSDEHRARIGDLLVASRDGTAIVQSSVDPMMANLIGHHGSITPAEQLVPLLTIQRG